MLTLAAGAQSVRMDQSCSDQSCGVWTGSWRVHLLGTAKGGLEQAPEPPNARGAVLTGSPLTLTSPRVLLWVMFVHV